MGLLQIHLSSGSFPQSLWQLLAGTPTIFSELLAPFRSPGPQMPPSAAGQARGRERGDLLLPVLAPAFGASHLCSLAIASRGGLGEVGTPPWVEGCHQVGFALPAASGCLWGSSRKTLEGYFYGFFFPFTKPKSRHYQDVQNDKTR